MKLTLAAIPLALALSGCAWLGHRATDAASLVDAGVTVSATPQYSANLCFFGLFALKWGSGGTDSKFYGLAGGQPRFGSPNGSCVTVGRTFA